MSFANLDLPLVFATLMGASILVYVLLDGYDLGVGMLMPAASEREQRFMVASIGPFWDANETWLVLGVGILLVAFPIAHGMVLGAIYLPTVAMLVGLMLRGVAFELRIKAEGWHRELWNWLFWFGSFLATFAQGMMLGLFISGLAPSFVTYLFAAMVGASLCGGYVLLGATWLIAKTEGELQLKAVRWARWGLAWVALGIALVSAATPLASATVRAKWFQYPGTLWLAILPIATIAAGVGVWRACARVQRGDHTREWHPFICAAAIFALAFVGLAHSLFPDVVMDRITIWDAAAHSSALEVVLIGVIVVVPFIVLYTLFSYYVFRGKARENLYDE